MSHLEGQESGAKPMQLRVFHLGTLHYDQSVFTYDRGCGAEVGVPTLAFLLQHPRGNVLFDTGLDPMMSSDPTGYWGQAQAKGVRPNVDSGQDIVSQLAQIDLGPDDIDFVVMSCLFRDHAGSLKYFPNSTLVVSNVEYQNALGTPAWLSATYNEPYEPRDLVTIASHPRVELLGDDWDLFGDGSVVVMSVPCHTEGEQALVVRLPETGTVVMPAGVIPTRENLDTEVMTGRLLVHPRDAYRSVRRLKTIIANENATVLLHHDPHEWRSYRTSPAVYK